MIRHAKLFETAGQQLLLHIAPLPCPCNKPDCVGKTLGVRVQMIVNLPPGPAVAETGCFLPTSMENLSYLLESLQQEHARQIVELIQQYALGLCTNAESRQQLVEILKSAVTGVK